MTNLPHFKTCHSVTSEPDSSESLSRAESGKIRVQVGDLEHISEVLTRILERTLDRGQLGKLLEQGGGRSHPIPRPEHNKAPLLVTTSYPSGGGVS